MNYMIGVILGYLFGIMILLIRSHLVPVTFQTAILALVRQLEIIESRYPDNIKLIWLY